MEHIPSRFTKLVLEVTVFNYILIYCLYVAADQSWVTQDQSDRYNII